MSVRSRHQPSGRKAWCADYRDGQGKRRVRQFRTKREAVAFLHSAVMEVKENRHVPRADAITMREAVALYLADGQRRVTAGELERRTLADIRGKLAHVLGEYGIPEFLVPLVTFATVDAMRLRLVAAGMSQANARKVVATVRAFLNWAVDHRIAGRNDLIGRKSKRQSREKVEVVIPASADMRRLLAAADDLPAPFGLYVRTAAFTGLRAGELRGLTWRHVDLDRALISVGQRAEQSGEIGLPKSATGHRDVPIPTDLLRRLREAFLAAGRDPDAFVFGRNGRPLDHDVFGSRVWRPMLRRLNLELRFHDLRHYYASANLAAGAAITEVARRLGHADATVTLRVYAHALPEGRTGREIDAIEAALSAV